MREEIQYAIRKIIDANERFLYRRDEESAMLLRATNDVVKEQYPKDWKDIRRIAHIQCEEIRRSKVEREFRWNF